MSSWEFGAELPPLSSPRGRLSSPVTPEEGQTQPHPRRAWRCKAAVERLCCWPSLPGPASSLITSSQPPCLYNKREGQRTRCSARNPTLQPLFSPNMKKGLIVFNNMLSIPTPAPSPPPSRPWLELESHLAPCSVPHYCWISLQRAPAGGTRWVFKHTFRFLPASCSSHLPRRFFSSAFTLAEVLIWENDWAPPPTPSSFQSLEIVLQCQLK